MAFNQAVDIAVYQRQDVGYFKLLKRNGAKGAFIQLNYGTGFPNPRAKNQIRYCSNILAFTGAYAFFLGNPVAEAKEFLAYLHHYGLDRTTPVMLDVEQNEAYNGPQTHLINEWTDIVARDGYKNIFIYSMASWLKDGYHIKPELLKRGKIWVAAYGTTEPGVVNSSVWQYTDNWHGLNTDGNYLFLPLSVFTGQSIKVKPKAKPKPKKPVSHYIQKGKKFKVISDVKGYKDLWFHERNSNFLKKGSTFEGRVIKCHGYNRLSTGFGYITANTKYTKAIG